MSIYKWSYLAKSKAPLLGKVLLTTNHLPDLHITTSNNQNNNKPLIVLVWTLWSSGFLKFSEWLTKSQWYHEMSTFMSLYNVQKQHNLALENVRKNSTHLSKSSSSVEPFSVWKGTGERGGMTHNCPKLKKYLFPGISWCIFAPGTGSPGESSCSGGSEYVWQRGQWVKSAWLWATFNQSPAIGKGLIKSRP